MHMTYEEKVRMNAVSFGKEAYLMLFRQLSGKYLDIASIAKTYNMNNISVISDMDGVLTDSTSSYSKKGKVLKSYGAYDGEMMLILKGLGCTFDFYTSDKCGCKIHKARWMQALKAFGDIHIPIKEATDWRARLSKARSLITEGKKVLYIGDSISDLNLLSTVNWFYTTSNAPDVVKHYAAFTSRHSGGYGGLADCLMNLLTVVADQH